MVCFKIVSVELALVETVTNRVVKILENGALDLDSKFEFFSRVSNFLAPLELP